MSVHIVLDPAYGGLRHLLTAELKYETYACQSSITWWERWTRAEERVANGVSRWEVRGSSLMWLER